MELEWGGGTREGDYDRQVWRRPKVISGAPLTSTKDT